MAVRYQKGVMTRCRDELQVKFRLNVTGYVIHLINSAVDNGQRLLAATTGKPHSSKI